jgi:DUF917 family protein
MEYLGHKSFDAIMGLEIGGANGLEPLLIGSSHAFDRPVIDGDWMGKSIFIFDEASELMTSRSSISHLLANNAGGSRKRTVDSMCNCFR